MEMTYVKWLRWGIIGGLFLTLIIPFIVANGTWFPGMYFPFITGKNFTFRILVEILFAAYVILALKEPQYRPRFSWVLVAVGLFTLWAGVATIFSVDWVKSFWSNFERMEGYLTMLHLFAYFLVMSAMLSAERGWTNFMRAWVWVSAVQGFIGLFQVFHWFGFATSSQSGPRLDGTFGNATYLAVYMLFNIFIALVVLKRDWRSAGLRWMYGAIILLDAFVLFFTETRGTLLGLVGGLIVAALYIALMGRGAPELARLRKISIGGLIAIAVLVAAFFAVKNTPWIQNVPALGRLASISLQDKTTISRFLIWGMALDGLKERPVTGWGQENFNFVFNKYYNPALYDQEQWFDRAHNAFVDWAMNGGAPGFLLFVSLFAAAVWAVWRAQSLSVPERAALLGLLAGYAFHELFVFDDIVSYLQFFALLAFIHVLTRRELPMSLALSRPLSENGIAVAAPIVVVVMAVGGWYLNAPGIANARELILAIQPQANASGAVNLNDNLAHFKSILSDGPMGRQEATEQLLQFSIAVKNYQSASPEAQQAFYTAAYGAGKELLSERPHDARLELFFGDFLNQFGKQQEALPYVQAASSDSPAKQSILYELGLNTYLPMGDTQQALATLKKAYELDTHNATAAAYYAQALYNAGQNSAADQLIKDHFTTLTPDNDAIMQVYYSTKQYSRAEAILQNRIAKDSTNTQAYVNLAQVYYSAGDKANALKTLQAAAKAVPSFASQALQLESQIQGQ